MSSHSWPETLCGLPVDDLLAKAEDFHGHISPGVMTGAFLVDVALSSFPPSEYINAVVESVVCLPDAVQLFTPCTLGNGFLQILDWGKFALTLYDRQTCRGVRAWVDPAAVAAIPEIAAWFMRGPGDGKIDKEVAIREILRRGHEIVKSRPVTLLQPLKDATKYPTAVCPVCGESYPTRFGDRCPSCGGAAYCQ